MNKIIMSAMAAGALAIAMPGLALAQKAPDSAKSTVQIPKKTFYRGLGPTQYLAKARFIGQPVLDKSGAEIGKIEDVIMGTNDNAVDGVVIGVGGFLGVNEKKIGVRLSALKLETKDGKTVITLPVATKEMLAALDGYNGEKTLMQKASEAARKAGDTVKATAKKAEDAAAKAVSK